MPKDRQRATIYFTQKVPFRDGGILEIRILIVPKPVLGSEHRFKYALFYGRKGRRLVLYDNERLKGDHRHRGDHQEPYRFTTIERLIGDFLEDVAAVRGRDHGEGQ
jgi:Family of unknown function (DUF6516)